MAEISAAYARLLTEPNLAAVTTLRGDGTPHVTPTWIDWDGEFVLVNTAYGMTKVRHVERNPQVAILVVDRNDPYTWISVGGPAELVDDGALEHLHELSWRYNGEPYPVPEGQRRVILRVRPDRVCER